MNDARWKADRERRDAEEPARLREIEIARIIGEGPPKPGDYVGTLQWSGADGKIRRYRIRRGPRWGQLTIDGIDGARNVTWLLDRLRRHLSSYFRCGRD
jgi:hypothetical protein